MAQYPSFDPNLQQALRSDQWRPGNIVAVRSLDRQLVYDWVHTSMAYWVDTMGEECPSLNMLYRIPRLKKYAEIRRAQQPIRQQQLFNQRYFSDFFSVVSDKAVAPAENLVDRLRYHFNTTRLKGSIMALDACIVNDQDAANLHDIAWKHDLLIILMLDSDPQHWPTWAEPGNGVNNYLTPRLGAPTDTIFTLRHHLDVDDWVSCEVSSAHRGFGTVYRGDWQWNETTGHFAPLTSSLSPTLHQIVPLDERLLLPRSR